MADIIQTAPEEKIIVEDPADENIIIEFSREEHDPFLDRAEVAALKAEFYAGDAERSAIASKAQADQSEESAVASDESQKAAAEHEEASSVSAQAAADSEQASALHEQGSAENAAESELQADRSEEHADRAESIANGLEDVIRNPGTFDPNSGYPTGFDPLIPQLWFANNDGDIDDVQWSIGQALLWEPNSASFYRVAGELVSGQGGGTFELSGSLIVPVNYGLFARGDLGNVHHLISLDEDRDVVIGKSALADPNGDSVAGVSVGRVAILVSPEAESDVGGLWVSYNADDSEQKHRVYHQGYTEGLATSTDLASIQSDLDAAEQIILDNTVAIADNTSDIAQNASNIQSNTQSISDNTESIAQNVLDIQSNTQSISDNTEAISQNTSDIEANSLAIDENTTTIEALTTNALYEGESTV